ncbi:MAG: ABC transporter ATP-binding protein [Selenomonadaceae bacterium]|nr:ABC transporter ATP-binding protein [Selenomonadaceae bacterium]
MEPVLEVRQLKKYFMDGAGKKKKTVLEGISFTLNPGECLGLVGRSGCGKSTTARLVTRLLPCDGGEIWLDGRDITRAEGRELAEAYGKMQMIFQLPEDSFDPRHTLGWSIEEPMRNQGISAAPRLERMADLLTAVGLSPAYGGRYPHEVSGGECQRAAIARAIALSPKLLICDEATSALDVTVQAQVVQLLRGLCLQQNIACLFITHDLALLPRIADRVAVMHGGRIVEEGATGQILKSPNSPYTQELMGADFFRLPPAKSQKN